MVRGKVWRDRRFRTALKLCHGEENLGYRALSMEGRDIFKETGIRKTYTYLAQIHEAAEKEAQPFSEALCHLP